MTSKLALHWLPCQAPGVKGSVLGLVSTVSVYYDWVRWKVWSATSVSVWQYLKLSEQFARTLSDPETTTSVSHFSYIEPTNVMMIGFCLKKKNLVSQVQRIAETGGVRVITSAFPSSACYQCWGTGLNLVGVLKLNRARINAILSLSNFISKVSLRTAWYTICCM